MAIEYIKGIGAKYIRFGDDEHMYQMFGYQDRDNPGTYKFEFRSDEDPNLRYSEFSLQFEDGTPEKDMFVAALEHTKFQMFSKAPEYTAQMLEHMQHHLAGTASELDGQEEFNEQIERSPFDFEHNMGVMFNNIDTPYASQFEEYPALGYIFPTPGHEDNGKYGVEPGNITDDIVNAAKAQMWLITHEDVEVTKEDGMVLTYSKDRERIGSIKADIKVWHSAAQDILPNGDEAKTLEQYDWADFEKLDELIQEQMENEDFTRAVEAIEESKGAEIVQFPGNK